MQCKFESPSNSLLRLFWKQKQKQKLLCSILSLEWTSLRWRGSGRGCPRSQPFLLSESLWVNTSFKSTFSKSALVMIVMSRTAFKATAQVCGIAEVVAGVHLTSRNTCHTLLISIVVKYKARWFVMFQVEVILHSSTVGLPKEQNGNLLLSVFYSTFTYFTILCEECIVCFGKLNI